MGTITSSPTITPPRNWVSTVNGTLRSSSSTSSHFWAKFLGGKGETKLGRPFKSGKSPAMAHNESKNAVGLGLSIPCAMRLLLSQTGPHVMAQHVHSPPIFL